MRHEGPEPMAPLEHGGLDLEELRRLGLNPAAIVDFSVCTNPYGPSPRVAEAIQDVCLDRYPDPDSHVLRAALAELHGLSPREILVGNGVSELIWLAAQALLRPRDPVLVLGPTYGEYARAALVQGARVAHWNGREKDNFRLARRTCLPNSSAAPRALCLCAIRTTQPAR